MSHHKGQRVDYDRIATRYDANSYRGKAVDSELVAYLERRTGLGTEKVAVGIPGKQRDIFVKMIPMGRAGTAEEAASTILFFASPLSDYVSGQVLICGGGFTM